MDIKTMVDRFLAWKLPKDFSPDGGVTFDRTYYSYGEQKRMEYGPYWPTGTNLLTAAQAREMFEYVLEGHEVEKGSEPDYDAVWSAFGATEFEDLHPILSCDHLRRLFKMFAENGFPAHTTKEAPTGFDAEFLSKRLARVAGLVGVKMPDMTHKQIAGCAGTILGEIARKLEMGTGNAPGVTNEAATVEDRRQPLDDLEQGLIDNPIAPKVVEPDCHKLDTPSQVFFYEQDFYVLSNFSAFTLQWKGIRFDTSEAAYHWEKFTNGGLGNTVRCAIIRDAKSAHEAFKYAEHHKEHRRPDWDEIKVDIMREILRAKADQHEYVRRKLLATGDRELIEDSWRDDFWGWGPNRDGKNMLGKLWMEIRAELRSTAHTDHPSRHYDRTCPGCATDCTLPNSECPSCDSRNTQGCRLTEAAMPATDPQEEPVAWEWRHVSNATGEIRARGVTTSEVKPTNDTWWDGSTSTVVLPLGYTRPQHDRVRELEEEDVVNNWGKVDWKESYYIIQAQLNDLESRNKELVTLHKDLRNHATQGWDEAIKMNAKITEQASELQECKRLDTLRVAKIEELEHDLAVAETKNSVTEQLPTSQLIARLRYQGKQYGNGQYARGGGSQKHYLEEAADQLSSLTAQRDRLAKLVRNANNSQLGTHTFRWQELARDVLEEVGK